MSDADAWELAVAYADNIFAILEMSLTVSFAVIVAGFMGGKRLTTSMFVVAGVLYTAWQSFSAIYVFSLAVRSGDLLLAVAENLNAQDPYAHVAMKMGHSAHRIIVQPYYLAGLMLLMALGTLWFLYKNWQRSGATKGARTTKQVD